VWGRPQHRRKGQMAIRGNPADATPLGGGCPACGAPVAPDAVACPNCGAAVNLGPIGNPAADTAPYSPPSPPVGNPATQTWPVASAPTAAPGQPRTAQPGSWECTQCLKQNPGRADRCEACGKPRSRPAGASVEAGEVIGFLDEGDPKVSERTDGEAEDEERMRRLLSAREGLPPTAHAGLQEDYAGAGPERQAELLDEHRRKHEREREASADDWVEALYGPEGAADEGPRLAAGLSISTECRARKHGDCDGCDCTCHKKRSATPGPSERLAAFEAAQGWFDGTAGSIRDREALARAIADGAEAAGDAATAALALAHADKLDEVAAEYESSWQREWVSGLPGGTVALEPARLVDGGLVDLGPDDGDWMLAEARAVQEGAASVDWEDFSGPGATEWVERQAERSPGMLDHEVVTRMAAADHARDRTAVLLDQRRRAEVINSFVEGAERARRRVLASRPEAPGAPAPDAFGEVEGILDEGGALW
jgi:hypothetical protein